MGTPTSSVRSAPRLVTPGTLKLIGFDLGAFFYPSCYSLTCITSYTCIVILINDYRALEPTSTHLNILSQHISTLMTVPWFHPLVFMASSHLVFPWSWKLWMSDPLADLRFSNGMWELFNS